MIRASILGATGYSGGELIRLLVNHPGVVLHHLTSESSPGRTVADIHPFVRGAGSLKFEKLNLARVQKNSDVVFSCYPHGVGAKINAKLASSGVKVIDLSADYRLPTAKMYKTWYKKSHPAPALLKSRVYGCPELFRNKIRSATFVANPGCYATASILAAAPLLKPLIVDPKSLVVDAKSGVSGAGKKVAPSQIFCEVNESLHAYSVAAHRHQPEIETILQTQGPSGLQLTFVPHLIPMNRGLLAVVYATLKKPVAREALRKRYEQAYAHEPFVRVLPESQTPQTKNVSYTNHCDIGLFMDRRLRRVIVIAAIDNLGKGAAGQAVQNMNLLFNRSETEGLSVS